MYDPTPPTEKQVRDYCATYATTIFVRVLRGFPGKYETMALSQVSLPERNLLVKGFVMRKLIPYRARLEGLDELEQAAAGGSVRG